MPFLTSASRALSALTLFIAITGAQQCYYPNGTPSPDVPCSSGDGDSSCCGANSWCMDNGLCFAGGLVSRGSCTDQTWESEACCAFCRDTSPSGSVAVTPCAADGSFSCGLNSCANSDTIFSMSGSGSMVLRPSQVQALVAPALLAAEQNSTACNAGKGTFTAGTVAAIGCGLGIPLLLAVVTIIFLYHSRRNNIQYDMSSPDPQAIIRLQPPMRRESGLHAAPYQGSPRGSTSTFSRHSSDQQPEHLKAWSERYRTVNKGPGPPVRVQEIRVELDASSEVMVHRHELASPMRSPR